MEGAGTIQGMLRHNLEAPQTRPADVFTGLRRTWGLRNHSPLPCRVVSAGLPTLAWVYLVRKMQQWALTNRERAPRLRAGSQISPAFLLLDVSLAKHTLRGLEAIRLDGSAIY